MSDSVYRFSEDPFPDVLYSQITERFEEYGLNTEEVPDDVHMEALRRSFMKLGTPAIYDKRLQRQVEIENLNSFVESYREKISDIDFKLNSRTVHDREVDALMEMYSETGDYDILIKDFEFLDPGYESWNNFFEDIEVEGWRSADNRVGSDTDFVGIDLEGKTITKAEVKTANNDLREGIRESKAKRADRQNLDFVNAVESAETEFSPRTTVVYTGQLTDDAYMMPDVFEGTFRMLADSEDMIEDIRELQKLINEMGKDQWSDLQPAERKTPI